MKTEHLSSAKEGRQHKTAACNDDTPPNSQETTVHHLFELQASTTPTAIAAVCGEYSLTYAQLNTRANQLARYLRACGAGTGSRVAILTNRNLNTLVAILAVLKSGASYVPIDLSLPAKRIAFILQDCGAPILLVDASSQAALNSLVVQLPQVIDVGDEGLYIGPTDDLALTVVSRSEAYCIYTSGSTGVPKGVMVHHQGLLNYVDWAAKTYVSEKAGNFGLYSSLSFDLTITSIFVPLVSGRRINVYPDTDDNVPALARLLEDNQVEVLKLTPAHAALLRAADLSMSRLQVLIFGGEDFKSDLALEVDRLLDGRAALYNEYGPTETVVGCMIHRFDPAQDTYTSVPLGTAIDNMHVLLLDEHLMPVPQGQVGQLYIGGDGVALGYHNNTELSTRRFISHPQIKGATLYATGDLARVNEVGQMHFLGREDFQVKLRGYRIELGEIEHALLAYPGLSECVVDATRSRWGGTATGKKIHCKRCGIESSFPNTTYSDDQICNHCASFDQYKQVIDEYFSDMGELKRIAEEIKAEQRPKYDCIVALSGGKDSTYALCRMVDMGMRVLAFTLDNGYLSEEAKANINRVVTSLGIEHRYLSTPHMDEIFADSLKRHSNVCNGCFKTIYTFALNLSQEVGVDDIVMGLSRGQLFETRLPALFRTKKFDGAVFERSLVDARKLYHRVDDAVGRLLDNRCSRNDKVIEKVRFIDFYRYCNVSRDEMYAYIEQHVGWSRPGDTGRSTNCLINDLGIYVHNKERGYHNYSLPYSWDVRIGHIERDAALRELEDSTDIDEGRVRAIMKNIGYELPETREAEDVHLVAYYVAPEEIPPAMLQGFLESVLPHYMVPAHFVHMDQLPLTPNGKVNRQALPRPSQVRKQVTASEAAPATPLELELASLWKEVLMVDQVGIHDNFFELGGHSLPALMLLYRISARYHKSISIQEFSKAPTISALSVVLADSLMATG